MMEEKQIDEIAEVLCNSIMCDLETFDNCRMPQGNCSRCQRVAKYLYNAGYRKQSDGEWKGKGYFKHCSVCGNVVNFNNVSIWLYNYCPNCGTKMKGCSEGVYNGALKLRIAELKKKYTEEIHD